MRKTIFSFAVLCSALAFTSCDSHLDVPDSPVSHNADRCTLNVGCLNPGLMRTRGIPETNYKLFAFDNSPMGWEAVCAVYNTDGTLYDKQSATGYGNLPTASMFKFSLPLNQSMKMIMWVGKRGYDGKCATVFNADTKQIKYTDEIIDALDKGANGLKADKVFNSTYVDPADGVSKEYSYCYQLAGKTSYCSWNTAFENFSKCGDCYYYFGDISTGAKSDSQNLTVTLTRPMVNVRLLTSSTADVIVSGSGSVENADIPWQLRGLGGEGEDCDSYIPVGYDVWNDRTVNLWCDIQNGKVIKGIWGLAGPTNNQGLNAVGFDKTYYYFANWYMFQAKKPANDLYYEYGSLEILRNEEVVSSFYVTQQMGQGTQISVLANSVTSKTVSANVTINKGINDSNFTNK